MISSFRRKLLVELLVDVQKMSRKDAQELVFSLTEAKDCDLLQQIRDTIQEQTRIKEHSARKFVH